ncbi:MAG: mercuric reductase [Candidatus Sumerlaeota bacterium]
MKHTGEVFPRDEYNLRLKGNVHPDDYENPDPGDASYNLVVIGAGSGGLVSALGAAGLGARVALVEQHLLGGDCLNVGCVPSKALIRSAREARRVESAVEYGIHVRGELKVDFAEVMERVRKVRADISANDAVERCRDKGVDVYLGRGRFVSRDAVEVAGRRLCFSKAVIATGARPFVPPVDGLADCAYLTNENVFDLTSLPERLAVIGGGPIGCELSQAFAQLGSRVTVLSKAAQFLPKEDAFAAKILEGIFRREGVELCLGVDVRSVRQCGAKTAIEFEGQDGGAREIESDAVLVATGRTPNVEDMGLDAAGVEYDVRHGVEVDSRLRTTNPKIYAVGDVCMQYKFTHAADAAARMVIGNALFMGRGKVEDLIIPWCTYTEPEIAHVGLSESRAADEGIEIDTYKIDLSDVDRALTDGEEAGFAKIHTAKGKGRIMGATIVAQNAGDMISEVTLAMQSGAGLGDLSKTIHPYPTQAEVLRKAADAYNRTRLTPLVAKCMKKWLEWTR